MMATPTEQDRERAKKAVCNTCCRYFWECEKELTDCNTIMGTARFGADERERFAEAIYVAIYTKHRELEAGGLTNHAAALSWAMDKVRSLLPAPLAARGGEAALSAWSDGMHGRMPRASDMQDAPMSERHRPAPRPPLEVVGELLAKQAQAMEDELFREPLRYPRWSIDFARAKVVIWESFGVCRDAALEDFFPDASESAKRIYRKAAAREEGE